MREKRRVPEKGLAPEIAQMGRAVAVAEKRRSYLLVPAGGAGEGMGHLVRCLSLAEQLGSRVSILTRHLDPAARRLLAERLSKRKGRGKPAIISKIAAARRWDLVVADARGIDAKELAELAGHGLVVCLDEGGEAREIASFTIDTLPGLPGRIDGQPCRPRIPGPAAEAPSVPAEDLPQLHPQPWRGGP